MNGKQMSNALGISPAMVSRLRKRGMPMDSVERAERWRNRHLEPARMKGARMDTAPRTSVTRRSHASLTEELRQLFVGLSPNAPLPHEVATQARQAVRRMAFEEFQRLYADAWGGDVVWRLMPAGVLAWDNWAPEGADDDWFESIPTVDLPLLHLVVAGRASFEFVPAAQPAAGPRPAFRDCVRLEGDDA